MRTLRRLKRLPASVLLVTLVALFVAACYSVLPSGTDASTGVPLSTATPSRTVRPSVRKQIPPTTVSPNGILTATRTVPATITVRRDAPIVGEDPHRATPGASSVARAVVTSPTHTVTLASSLVSTPASRSLVPPYATAQSTWRGTVGSSAPGAPRDSASQDVRARAMQTSTPLALSNQDPRTGATATPSAQTPVTRTNTPISVPGGGISMGAAEWDHSSIEVVGSCKDGQTAFAIRNSGDGDMYAPSQYRVYENATLVRSSAFQLRAGKTVEVTWRGITGIVRLEADQRPGFAGRSQNNAEVRDCGAAWPTATWTAIATSTATHTPSASPTRTPLALLTPNRDITTVQWMWHLPDMRSTEPGMQYGSPTNLQQHDDDMGVQPDRNLVPSAHHMMQVGPNLENLPETRLVEHWIAINRPKDQQSRDGETVGVQVDPGGDVSVAVYHPDGSLFYRLKTSKVACSVLGSKSIESTPLEAAVRTGQMTPERAETILQECRDGKASVYRAVATLGVEEPAGEYRAEAVARGEGGSSSTLASFFDVQSVVGLRIDFDKVDFGPIQPNTPRNITDNLPSTQALNSGPAVRNVGNAPLHLRLQFGPMVGRDAGTVIDEFSAEIDHDDIPHPEKIEPIAAGSAVCFGSEIKANRVARLDLSVRPKAVPPDAYFGIMQLTGSLNCP